jgi:acyl-CoA dehydrogenase
MFTMINWGRLATGLQGVAIAERAYQQALAFAQERRQGRAPGASAASPIIDHPDVRRMLMTMRALTGAARALAYVTAEAIDRAKHGADAAAQARTDLLTPVTKAFCSDVGMEVASLGIQVHGGMGYVEETGAAQHLRDVRVAAIYEGTNGIQAIDLVTRKLPHRGGEPVRGIVGEWRAIVADAARLNDSLFGGVVPRMSEALDALEAATAWLLAADRDPEDALAGATPYLRLFGLTAGGALLTRGALAAFDLARGGAGDPRYRAHAVTARFYAENLATGAAGLARTVIEGAGSVREARDALIA